MRQAQHVADQVCQATVRAGGDIQGVETTGLQEAFETVGVVSGQRIADKELIAEAPVGREGAPGVQTAHVELLHPGVRENVSGQFEPEFATRDVLGTGLEIILVLQRG